MKKQKKRTSDASKQQQEGQPDLAALTADLERHVAELRATARVELDDLARVRMFHLSTEGREAWEARVRSVIWVLLTTEPAFHPMVEEYARLNVEQPVMPPEVLITEIGRILGAPAAMMDHPTLRSVVQ